MVNLCHTGLRTSTCVALLTLAACGQESQDHMNWARAALERNSDIQVMSADQQNRTFTVRVKDSGELRVVRADELIGAPGSVAPPAATVPSQASQRAMAGEATTAAARDATAVPVSASAAPAGAQPAEAAPAAASTTPASATAAATGAGPQPSSPSASQSSLLPQTANASDSSPGKVLESGPGYSIKAASPEAPVPGGRVRETSVTSAALERRHEPIVCQGARLMQIDNRNLAFDGDAVSAEDGCEIHITNSHISAGGVGVLARAANVHIDNSLIEGDQGSIDASEGAQVYFASSRFRGLSRRLDSAAFHDLGGNVWN